MKTGDVITITADSDAYGFKESISIPVENQIEISLDYDGAQVAIGEDIYVGFNVRGYSLDLHPKWSVDKKWVGLSTGDSGVTLSIGYDAKKGDSFVLTAEVPNTDLSVSQRFTVSDGLSLKLTSSSAVVEAGSEFTISAVVKPLLPPDATLSWDVDYDGLTYTVQDGTLSGKVSSDAGHNVKVTVTASIDGYGIEASTTFTTSNPSKIPVEITTAQDMLKMKGSTKVFDLQNDIDMSSMTWVPFEFNGVFNGNGYAIVGLRCIVTAKTSGMYYAGLFSENKGTINDLVIASASLSVAPDNLGAYTMIYAGAVCGVNSGTISGVTIESSSILAHSTNIRTSWLANHTSIPDVGTGSAKSGDWYDYASLKFTGTYCNSWTKDARMNVFCGGVAGTNSGSIVGTSTNINIDAEVINFNYTADTAKVYAGGIVGSNSGTISNVVASGEVNAELVLHDSGDGSGAGYGYVDSYTPVATGYVGALAGFSKSVFSGSSSVTVTSATEVYAPTYFLFDGSHYDTNGKADYSKITWHKNGNIGGTS